MSQADDQDSLRTRTVRAALETDTQHGAVVPPIHLTSTFAFGGYGVHHCLGASLARLELKILFEELLARMPDIRLASDEPLERRPNNFITGIEKMPVVFTPSRASA